MEIEQTWLDYLDIIASEGKDASDPTYLMQAFALTKDQAEQAIAVWKAQSG
jgi:hypothetical protein